MTDVPIWTREELAANWNACIHNLEVMTAKHRELQGHYAALDRRFDALQGQYNKRVAELEERDEAELAKSQPSGDLTLARVTCMQTAFPWAEAERRTLRSILEDLTQRVRALEGERRGDEADRG